MGRSTTVPLDRGGVASVEDALAVVRANGGRVTTSRRLVLEALFSSAEHLSAEEVAHAVQVRAPDVHLSTVYRNLEDLQRLGVLVHTHVGHGPVTYQVASSAHAHLVCEGCGRTFEAPDTLFRGLAHQVKAELGFVLDPHHVAMVGRCADCAP